MVLCPCLVRCRSLLQPCCAPTVPLGVSAVQQRWFHPAANVSDFTHENSPSVVGNDMYITFKHLLIAVCIACPRASEKNVQYAPALRDLLTASGSQFPSPSRCSVSQYFVLNAVVFLSQLHSSWLQGKRTFPHLLSPMLFPINMVKWCWFPNHTWDMEEKCRKETDFQPCSFLSTLFCEMNDDFHKFVTSSWCLGVGKAGECFVGAWFEAQHRALTVLPLLLLLEECLQELT